MPRKVRLLRNHCMLCPAVATNRQSADPQVAGRAITASVGLDRVAGTRLGWNRCHSGRGGEVSARQLSVRNTLCRRSGCATSRRRVSIRRQQGSNRLTWVYMADWPA